MGKFKTLNRFLEGTLERTIKSHPLRKALNINVNPKPVRELMKYTL